MPLNVHQVLVLGALLASVRSAAPPCAVFDQGYVDPDVPTVNGGIDVQDAQACQTFCANLVTCKVFTFYVNSGGCWLQGMTGQVSPLQNISGVWSGPRECPGAEGASSANESAAGAGGTGAAAAEENGTATSGAAAIVATPPAAVVATGPPPTSMPAAVATPDQAATAADDARGAAAGTSTEEGDDKEHITGPLGFLPWWAYVLGLLGLLIFGVLCCMLCGKVRKGRDKKVGNKKNKGANMKSDKRSRAAETSLDSVSASEVEIPLVPKLEEEAQPVPTQSAPLPMYAPYGGSAFGSVPSLAPPYLPPPVYAQAVPAPGYSVPTVPVAYSAPVAYMAPMASAEPVFQVMSMQAPAVMMAPQQPQSLFDRLDRNHDGVITRDEFNQLR